MPLGSKVLVRLGYAVAAASITVFFVAVSAHKELLALAAFAVFALSIVGTGMFHIARKQEQSGSEKR
jgi:hypothetical protein